MGGIFARVWVSLGDSKWYPRPVLSLAFGSGVKERKDHVELLFYGSDLVPLEGEER